jgi:hypothetical protein
VQVELYNNCYILHNTYWKFTDQILTMKVSYKINPLTYGESLEENMSNSFTRF